MNLFHHFRKLSVTDSFKNVIRHFPVFVKNGKKFSEKGLFFVYFGRLLKNGNFVTLYNNVFYMGTFSHFMYFYQGLSAYFLCNMLNMLFSSAKKSAIYMNNFRQKKPQFFPTVRRIQRLMRGQKAQIVAHNGI